MLCEPIAGGKTRGMTNNPRDLVRCRSRRSLARMAQSSSFLNRIAGPDPRECAYSPVHWMTRPQLSNPSWSPAAIMDGPELASITLFCLFRPWSPIQYTLCLFLNISCYSFLSSSRHNYYLPRLFPWVFSSFVQIQLFTSLKIAKSLYYLFFLSWNCLGSSSTSFSQPLNNSCCPAICSISTSNLYSAAPKSSSILFEAIYLHFSS